jgi:hypothetical protein
MEIESNTYLISNFKLKKQDDLTEEKLKTLFLILSKNKTEITMFVLNNCIESMVVNFNLPQKIKDPNADRYVLSVVDMPQFIVKEIERESKGNINFFFFRKAIMMLVAYTDLNSNEKLFKLSPSLVIWKLISQRDSREKKQMIQEQKNSKKKKI